MAVVSVENLEQTPHLLLHTLNGKRYLPLAGRSYWTIGRGQNSDLVIRDQCISRNHAILQSTEAGEFFLIDLGSRNGTFVNGRRVSIPVTLHNSDLITFGKTDVEFYSPSPDRQTDAARNIIERDTFVLHERRLMSVMVVDIRNFTKLSRQLDEKVLSSLIGNWFRQAGDIIRQSGSWVDKYIGDAIMAIWFHGEKEVTKADVVDIFQAVSDLNQMTEDLNDQYPLPFELRIGAGINTGYAMVGNTGSGEHPDYTAIGDTVNAAFRLESATKELKLDVAVGAQTYQYLAGMEQAEALFQQDSVILKGYEDPTITHAINFRDLEAFLDANVEIDT